MRITKRILLVLLTLAVCLPFAAAQGKLTSPKQEFGFNVGDDYQLVNYTQALAYLQEAGQGIGPDEPGRDRQDRRGPARWSWPSSPRPENLRKLDRYKEIARRLALAEGLTDDQARELAPRGQGGGLDRRRPARHRGARRAAAHRDRLPDGQPDRRGDAALPRRRDPARRARQPRRAGAGRRLVHARDRTRPKRSTGGLPRLYQKYIGHDNNRDFYMSTQPETENINRRALPRVVPADRLQPPPDRPGRHGAVLPAVPRPVQLQFRSAGRRWASTSVGAAMHSRFVAEGKPGATMRSGASYSTWWNGGLRTTGVLPQHDRPPDRDHRQPDARCSIPFIAQHQMLPAATIALPDRAPGSGTSGSRSTTR